PPPCSTRTIWPSFLRSIGTAPSAAASVSDLMGAFMIGTQKGLCVFGAARVSDALPQHQYRLATASIEPRYNCLLNFRCTMSSRRRGRDRARNGRAERPRSRMVPDVTPNGALLMSALGHSEIPA